MQMPNDVALWLQKTLLGLDKEDWGLGYMLDGNVASAPPDTPERWQLGADMIYRTVVCNLVAVNDLGACPDKASFFQAIQTLDPHDVSGAGFWHATLVWGTERLSGLIEAYFPPRGERDSKLNPTFIAALEQIFDENGVPWSDKPLLPVTPAGGADDD
jgi:hypothetical protein